MPASLAVAVRNLPRRHLEMVLVGPVHDYELDSFRDLLVAAAQRSNAADPVALINEVVTQSRGAVRLSTPRCTECRGRGWSERSLRAGQRVCRTCQGSRRGQSRLVTVRALPTDK